jgi:Family of unknown function (DUF695)
VKLIFKTIIASSLLSSVFGCKDQNKIPIYPKESKGELNNGKPLIGSINMSYKDYDKKKDYPWCLEINMALNLDSLYENGLPHQNESDVANKFEDELVENLKKVATIHYIGHLYNDSFLDIYIYLDDADRANNYLKQEVNKDGVIRPFSYKIKKDPDWLTVQGLFR